MTKFFWKGIDCQGHVRKGTMHVISPDELKNELLEQEIALLSYRKVMNVAAWLTLILPKKVTDEQRILFFEHMASLINHGVTVAQALVIFHDQTENIVLKEGVGRIVNKVEMGISFADALREEPVLFNPFIAQLVESGEKSGSLGFTLEKITVYLRDKYALKKELIKAATLPLMTLTSAVVLVAGIFIFIIPHFELIFATLEKPMPATTMVVISLSRFLRSGWGLLVLVSLPCSFLGIKKVVQHKKMTNFRDRLCLLFFVKRWYLFSMLIHFLQTLSMFLKAGVPLKQALEAANETIHHKKVKEKMMLVTDAVTQGKSLALALRQIGPEYVPEKVVSLVAIGEQSGQLATMIDQAAALMQSDFKNRLHVLVTLLQPCLLIVVGLLIAAVMISVYLPIFTMASLV